MLRQRKQKDNPRVLSSALFCKTVAVVPPKVSQRLSPLATLATPHRLVTEQCSQLRSVYFMRLLHDFQHTRCWVYQFSSSTNPEWRGLQSERFNGNKLGSAGGASAMDSNSGNCCLSGSGTFTLEPFNMLMSCSALTTPFP